MSITNDMTLLICQSVSLRSNIQFFHITHNDIQDHNREALKQENRVDILKTFNIPYKSDYNYRVNIECTQTPTNKKDKKSLHDYLIYQ